MGLVVVCSLCTLDRKTTQTWFIFGQVIFPNIHKCQILRYFYIETNVFGLNTNKNDSKNEYPQILIDLSIWKFVNLHYIYTHTLCFILFFSLHKSNIIPKTYKFCG